MDGIVGVHVDTSQLVKTFEHAVEPDEALMLHAHSRFAQYCAPYVPMESGTLSQTTHITPDYVEWTQEYAHYMYMGEIYGPNIPIKDNATGTIVGYFSPPGKQKHPTGRKLTYSNELHPQATDHWGDAAVAAHMPDLLADIGRHIEKRMKGGGEL